MVKEFCRSAEVESLGLSSVCFDAAQVLPVCLCGFETGDSGRIEADEHGEVEGATGFAEEPFSNEVVGVEEVLVFGEEFFALLEDSAAFADFGLALLTDEAELREEPDQDADRGSEDQIHDSLQERAEPWEVWKVELWAVGVVSLFVQLIKPVKNLLDPGLPGSIFGDFEFGSGEDFVDACGGFWLGSNVLSVDVSVDARRDVV